jgi:hypothetical protein
VEQDQAATASIIRNGGSLMKPYGDPKALILKRDAAEEVRVQCAVPGQYYKND